MSWAMVAVAAGTAITAYSQSQNAKKAQKDASNQQDKSLAAQKEQSRMDTARNVWLNQQARVWGLEDRRRIQDTIGSYGSAEAHANDKALIDPTKGIVDFNPGAADSLDKLAYYFHPENAPSPEELAAQKAAEQQQQQASHKKGYGVKDFAKDSLLGGGDPVLGHVLRKLF